MLSVAINGYLIWYAPAKFGTVGPVGLNANWSWERYLLWGWTSAGSLTTFSSNRLDSKSAPGIRRKSTQAVSSGTLGTGVIVLHLHCLGMNWLPGCVHWSMACSLAQESSFQEVVCNPELCLGKRTSGLWNFQLKSYSANFNFYAISTVNIISWPRENLFHIFLKILNVWTHQILKFRSESVI